MILCHFLQVCVWSETVSPPPQRVCPSSLPQILDSIMLLCHCILTGTIPAVPEWAPSAECLLVLFALCWPNLALGGGHPGTSTCMHVLSWYLCNTLGSCDTGYRIPQNHWFQHKALCLGHRRTVCGVAKPRLQAGGGFISSHSPPPCRNLVCLSWWPLQVETAFSAASFPYLL